MTFLVLFSGRMNVLPASLSARLFRVIGKFCVADSNEVISSAAFFLKENYFDE